MVNEDLDIVNRNIILQGVLWDLGAMPEQIGDDENKKLVFNCILLGWKLKERVDKIKFKDNENA